MQRRPSPLDPLGKLRDERVDDAGRALGDALTAARNAKALLRKAEQSREDELRANEEVRTVTRGSLERGELRVDHLAQAAHWEAGAAQRAATAEASCTRAAGEVTQADVVVDESRATVASAKADADVVKRLQAKEAAAREARQTAATEESAEDSFNARLQLRPRRS